MCTNKEQQSGEKKMGSWRGKSGKEGGSPAPDIFPLGMARLQVANATSALIFYLYFFRSSNFLASSAAEAPSFNLPLFC